MPITPFHFGPGALLHAVAPKRVSFLAFCAANIAIDAEVLYNIATNQSALHTFFHTYVGATLVILGVVAAFIAVRKICMLPRLEPYFKNLRLTVKQVIVGATLGAYSHIVLDSFMHRDMHPLAPLTQENALLGLISLSTLHWLCIWLGVAGLAVLGLRKLLAK